MSETVTLVMSKDLLRVKVSDLFLLFLFLEVKLICWAHTLAPLMSHVILVSSD